MLSGRAVLLQLFWTSVSCVLADDESSTQGKSENILESLERSMHPELMKVLCLQDHSPHPQLLLSSLSVRRVFYFLYLQLWWSWAGTKSWWGLCYPTCLSHRWSPMVWGLFCSSPPSVVVASACFFLQHSHISVLSVLCISSCITKATWKRIILFWFSSFSRSSLGLSVARH